MFVVVLLSGALIAAVAGCGGSGGKDSGAATVTETGAQAKFAGTAITPPKPAPPLALTSFDGREVRLSDYRGEAVLLTFIYTHCPDTCPLIVSNLRVAQSELGAQAREVQIVAVSTDPSGDTPQAAKNFLRQRRMLGRMQYLLGSKAQLEPVWKDWYIQAEAAPGPKDRVGHTAAIYGVSASGKAMTLYPANFRPAQIVHDVPLLASE